MPGPGTGAGQLLRGGEGAGAESRPAHPVCHQPAHARHARARAPHPPADGAAVTAAARTAAS